MIFQNTFFEGIEVKQRERKHREKGLTMMIDWGLGLLLQEDTLQKRFPPKKLIFEIPGPWNPGSTLSKAHDMKIYLIENFGHEVNLGNILPQDVVELEALRLNLGVGMKLK